MQSAWWTSSWAGLYLVNYSFNRGMVFEMKLYPPAISPRNELKTLATKDEKKRQHGIAKKNRIKTVVESCFYP